MIRKILEQLEILGSRTLEENIQLCGQLELAIKKWQSWRRLAQAVHLLLFGAAGSLFMIMTWVEVLMETGRGAEIPPKFNPVFPRMLTEADTPVLYQKYFTLILILLILPIFTDILFAVKSKGPLSKSLSSSAPLVLKSPHADEQFSYLEKSLKQAHSALYSSGSGILQHGICIVFALTTLYICVAIEYANQLSEKMSYCIGAPLLVFVLCEAAFLISSLPMKLLFSTGKEQNLLLEIQNKKLSWYRGTLREETRKKEEEARKKEEEAKLAAMTPAERRQYEWLQEHEARKREAEARKREEKKRQEEKEMEEFLATHRAACRFYSGGICNYYSNPNYTSHCSYYNNPGQCSACLVENGLIFVEK